MEGLTTENSTMHGEREQQCNAKRKYFYLSIGSMSPQVPQPRNECITSDENIVIIYLVSQLFTPCSGKRGPIQKLRLQVRFKQRYQNTYVGWPSACSFYIK